MTTVVITVLSVLLTAALAYLGITEYKKRTANNVQPETDAVETTNPWTAADFTPRTRNQGVLLAITKLPTSVIEALRKVFPELGNLSDGTVTTDEQGLVFELEGDAATLTLRPFAEHQTITLTSTRYPNVHCTVSYADGFQDRDLDELTGFYGRLSASNGTSIISFAELLTQSVVHESVPTASPATTDGPADA